MSGLDRVLIRTPKTPWPIRVVGILIGLAIAAVIVQVVLIFAWYASGLAAEKAERDQRKAAPIPVNFGSQ